MSRSANAWAYHDADYLHARAALLSMRPICHEQGCENVATVADHFPPLSQHEHRRGAGCCVLRPHCQRHSSMQGGTLSAAVVWGNGATPEPDAEPVGLGSDHPLWLLPWIEPFTDVPANAVWPRLMTPPHPRAVGSLGPEFVAFAQGERGVRLRWWQALAATRLLEVDEDGRLVWRAALLSTARQVGKSVLLRELLLWRMLHFAAPQLVVHVAKDRGVAREVQRSARMWAQGRREFSVTSANGFETIEHASGSRWIIKSRSGVYGHSSTFVAVDEAWGVKAEEVEDAIAPTLVESASGQLVLVSTANRHTTSLMPDRRRTALELLDEPGTGDLLIEWSAPPGADFQSPETWRLASPHWSEQREQTIRGAVARALNGDGDGDDPTASVKSQWLNRWQSPVRRVQVDGERLLAPGAWWDLRTSDHVSGKRLTIALEDHYGSGASVAACGDLDDNRWLLAGWRFDSRADALAKVLEFTDLPVTLVVGASLAVDPDVVALPVRRVLPGAGPRTRQGLALLRELAGEQRVAWDPADGIELADAIEEARVAERTHGLVQLGARTDLVRAASWALVGQAVRPRVPAIR